MTRKNYDFRLAWLGITNQQVIDALNQRGFSVTRSRVSECFSASFRTVEWAERLRAELDLYTAKLIEEKRKEIEAQLRERFPSGSDLHVILPVDDGYPIVSGQTVIGRFYPGTGAVS